MLYFGDIGNSLDTSLCKNSGVYNYDYKTLITFVHDKAFFSIMQNKTDKGTLLVSKSLPVANSNSVYRLFSARISN